MMSELKLPNNCGHLAKRVKRFRDLCNRAKTNKQRTTMVTITKVSVRAMHFTRRYFVQVPSLAEY